MNKFSIKSILYLPLMALAIGIIPVMLLPPGQMVEKLHYNGELIQAFNNQMFPFHNVAYSLIWVEFVLLIPIGYVLVSQILNKKSYQGLYAFFVVVGFMLKAQSLDTFSYSILAFMGLMAAINIMSYLYVTGDTFDNWLVFYFGKSKQRAASGPDGKYYGPVFNQNNGTPNLPTITNYAKISVKKFRHIVGMSELKEKLLKAGKEILSNQTNNASRNGILLTGEPGNGKTTMAEALAGELNLPIINVAIGNFQSMWIGETTQNVMKVFDDAERQAPCVLFIDEIEAILIDRSNSGSKGFEETPKLVSALLKRLVDIRRHKVILIAATNFIDRLDPASIREGRFDYKIEVLPPDFEARKHLLQDGLKTVANLIDESGLERAAKRWEGFSVSRIRAVATETLEQVSSQKISKIGFDELAQALRSLSASKGDRIPEDAKSIEQLVLAHDMRERLSKLAIRMTRIDEIEEMGGSVPSGALFYGPAGTGKTIAAMALAKASRWAFIKTSGHDLLHSPEKIDEIMKRAKDIRPCIIFIDEADDVLADRRSSILSKDVTNKLLTIMDGAGGRTKDVLFIAATNAPDLIDDAMLRGGRFTEKIAFDVPNQEDLLSYISNWIHTTKARLGNDFTAESVAEALKGQSLANAGEILQSAVNEAISTGENKEFKVEMAHLKAAINLIKGSKDV